MRCNLSRRSRANTRCGRASPKPRSFRRSRNWASGLCHTARSARAFSPAKSMPARPSRPTTCAAASRVRRRGPQGKPRPHRPAAQDRRDAWRNTGTGGARLAAGAEALDCAAVWHPEPRTLRREYRLAERPAVTSRPRPDRDGQYPDRGRALSGGCSPSVRVVALPLRRAGAMLPAQNCGIPP
jgi:hypothetical protein